MQRSLLLAGELVKILTLFKQHQIAAVPYKEPVLANAVYGGVAFRQYCDLDIVVQQENVLPAKLLLKSSDPAASGRGMEADLLPNSRFGLQASCFRRRAAGNLPVLD